MILPALILSLALPNPSLPLGVKTAKVVSSLNWAKLPSKDAQGQPQRLAIELSIRTLLPEPFPIHLRVPRAGLPANPPRLMYLREVNAKGEIEARTACQWDDIDQATAELTWFVPRGPAGVRRFALDFAPADTDVVIGLTKAAGKLVYAAHKKAVYTLNPVGTTLDKVEIDGLKPPNVAAGRGFDEVPGTEARTFKLVNELNGPLCYRIAAKADGRIVKRLSLYAGIYWHETEIHGKPARLMHSTIDFANPLKTARSIGAHRKDGLLLGIASVGAPAVLNTLRFGFDARCAGPVARLISFAGPDSMTVASPTLERLVSSAEAIESASARISVIRN